MDDPETEDWLSKAKHRAAKPNILPYLEETGDIAEEQVQRIIDDPETEDWLAKKGNYTKSELKGILADPETQRWLAKKGSCIEDAPTNPSLVLEILDDPETEEWLAKRNECTSTAQTEASSAAAELPGSLARQPAPSVETQPGAYSGAPGEGLQRRDNLQFSHVGILPDVEAEVQENNEQLASLSREELAEAMPVQDDPLHDMEAQLVDMAAVERRLTEAKKTKRRQLLGMALFLLVLLVAIALVFVTQKQDEKAGLLLSPTAAPTAVQSQFPSFAPSGALDALMEGLPKSTLASLESISTPQWRAFNWLDNHPNITDVEEWRKQQLFALVTFFYAIGGEAWPQGVKDEWLRHDKLECFWYSSMFGQMGEDGKLIENTAYQDKGWGDPCNEKNEFQNLGFFLFDMSQQKAQLPPEITLLTSLRSINLAWNDINGTLAEFLPHGLDQCSNLTHLSLQGNYLTGAMPSQLGQVTSMTHLDFRLNELTGPVPSELGLMTNLSLLDIGQNNLTDPVPSELGLMEKITVLFLNRNMITGPIPSDLGQLTSMQGLSLADNRLTGRIPSVLRDIVVLSMDSNSITGSIPSQLGQMNATWLHLSSNRLTGLVPSELALMTILKTLELTNNLLTGTVPLELGDLAANGSLLTLNLANNSLSGSIPEALCSLGLFGMSGWNGLLFDCSNQLCGCCWCPCPGINYTGECQSHSSQFQPSEDDEDWPGAFPSRPNAVTINARTDEYPEEITLEWSTLEGTGLWQTLDTHQPANATSIHSYTELVDTDNLYRVQIIDAYGDGTCCGSGLGWFTITSSTPSNDHTEGSVIWEATGDALESSLDVYIRIDSNGTAQEVAYAFLEEEDNVIGDNITLSVMPDALMWTPTNSSTGNVEDTMG